MRGNWSQKWEISNLPIIKISSFCLFFRAYEVFTTIFSLPERPIGQGSSIRYDLAKWKFHGRQISGIFGIYTVAIAADSRRRCSLISLNYHIHTKTRGNSLIFKIKIQKWRHISRFVGINVEFSLFTRSSSSSWEVSKLCIVNGDLGMSQ